MLGVLVVDDHPVVAMGLKLILRNHESIRFLGSAHDLQCAATTFGNHPPDIVVLDLVFESWPRIVVVSRCRGLWPQATIIVFSTLPAARWADRCRKAGAVAFVEKTDDLTVLVSELERAGGAGARTRAGQSVLGCGSAATAPSKEVARLQRASVLTPREKEIAKLIAVGRSLSDIAAQLEISRNTVAVHQENIRKKLACDSVKTLVAHLAITHANGL